MQNFLLDLAVIIFLKNTTRNKKNNNSKNRIRKRETIK